MNGMNFEEWQALIRAQRNGGTSSEIFNEAKVYGEKSFNEPYIVDQDNVQFPRHGKVPVEPTPLDGGDKIKFAPVEGFPGSAWIAMYNDKLIYSGESSYVYLATDEAQLEADVENNIAWVTLKENLDNISATPDQIMLNGEVYGQTIADNLIDENLESEIVNSPIFEY